MCPVPEMYAMFMDLYPVSGSTFHKMICTCRGWWDTSDEIKYGKAIAMEMPLTPRQYDNSAFKIEL